MLMEAVLKAAEPYLKDRRVRDAVIGISLIAVELDDGSVGVAYVLRDELEAGCSIFPYGQHVIGQDASGISQWVVSGEDSLQRSVGIAVLGAASHGQELKDSETPDRPFGVSIRDSDTIGMIGFIPPVAKMMSSRAKKLYIWDKGILQCGGANVSVLPMEEQPRLLPACDIVMLSGTTMINGSLDGLLDMCSGAREVIMIGASTPMFPSAFLGAKVTVLAGSWWKSEHKDVIFKKISLACGISDIREYAIKKSVRVAS